MKIAITGSSGLIGRAVSARLQADGHSITRMVRSSEAANERDAIYWSPAEGAIDSAGLAGHDAVINLAGENIFGIWTAPKKRRMYASRVGGTKLLAETLAGLEDSQRPEVLVNASAIGYYGDRPADEPLTEAAAPGEDGFMVDLVREWESATGPAEAAGVRVVTTRFGLVLDPHGVLLRGVATATRVGLGAKLGAGDQVFPWTTRDEIANTMAFLLSHEKIRGPLNVTNPDKVTNEEFADTVARVLNRPRLLRVPALAIRMLGDLGNEVLSGAWVVPEKLVGSGYRWLDPTLEGALRRLLRP